MCKKSIDKFLNKIIHGNTLDVLKQMPDESVDTIITSPPYWGLRDYGEETNTIWGGDKGCEHEFELEHIQREPSKTGEISEKAKIGQGYRNYKSGFCKKCGAFYGQLGLEPTLDMYIDHMLQITAELKRVLKKTGVFFLNWGDSYGGSDTGQKGMKESWAFDSSEVKPKYKHKCMALQNYRTIIRMIDEQGWILRDTIIWAKKVWIAKENKTVGNAMPSSVRDRCSFTYEPVFMLVKDKNYYFDQDAIRVPYTQPLNRWGGDKLEAKGKSEWDKGTGQSTYRDRNMRPNILGANRPNVWQINTESFPMSHFAVFGERLVEPMIKAGCPQWICKKCGKARVRITEPTEEYKEKLREGAGYYENYKKAGRKSNYSVNSQYYTIGWTDCGCNAGWRPGIVLDPFAGSGTTLLVARKLNRHYIGIEINKEYIKMAEKRLRLYKANVNDWL